MTLMMVRHTRKTQGRPQRSCRERQQASSPSLGKLAIKDFTKTMNNSLSLQCAQRTEVLYLLSRHATQRRIRLLAQIPPRPLHDPMADHAIVLYDPTLDECETDEERKNAFPTKLRKPLRKKQRRLTYRIVQSTQKPETIARSGPLKTLVVDPIIGSKLRPHQIESVKVGHKRATRRSFRL